MQWILGGDIAQAKLEHAKACDRIGQDGVVMLSAGTSVREGMDIDGQMGGEKRTKQAAYGGGEGGR